MGNDSSTGGYLLPAAGGPSFDNALDDAIQQAVVGITGLPGSLVRPRWQPIVAKQPPIDTDWCAIGVTDTEPDDYPVQDQTATGSDLIEHETITVLATMYGPQAAANAKALRNGLYVAQNREGLLAAGINLTDTGKPIAAMDFVNQQWVRRYDLTIRFRRKTIQNYDILTILSAEADVHTDTHEG